ncbi:hypothetical protein Ait01nite_059070 [Actinoplanes italicus]|nr:hypothetical protein Ait01nite_059070 [Actinoplanes italicus]
MASSTKNTITAGQATSREPGRVAADDTSTGTTLSAHTETATAGHHRARNGRNRLTNRNVNNGLANSSPTATIATSRGGAPITRRARPSTNSIATDANIHITSRSNGSRRRRYRHDTHNKITVNSDVTRSSAMGSSVPPDTNARR